MSDDGRRFRPPAGPRLALAAAAAIGWVIVALGIAWQPQRAWLAYLAAYVFTVTTALGALCLVMIAHVTGARWLVLVRRLAEAICGALPVLALLALPLLFALPYLYPWAAAAPPLDEHARQLLDRKRAYLNVPFFVVRTLVYVAIWSTLAVLLRRWSLRQDRLGAAGAGSWITGLSGGGLMLFAFTLTFAAFDWVMSLDPLWQSSIFGMYMFCGAMTAALGLLIVVTALAERGGALAGEVAASHYHALGRLLLTFVALWAYMAFAQGLLIWIADIPDEVRFYTARLRNGWGVLLLILALGQFLLPFLLLLSRPLKRRGRRLALLGGWMLLMHYLDVFWLVVPALHGATPFHWFDLPALVAIGATAVLAGMWSIAGQALVAWRDPRLPAALAYRSP